MPPPLRECSIEIENKTSEYTLCNSRWYTHSGQCETPFPPSIGFSESGSALFTKTQDIARGAVGVFTYDLLNGTTKQHDVKIAVMFSVPYDINVYTNVYAVGIFEMSQSCDRSLYKLMYHKKKEGFDRGKAKERNLIYTSNHLTVKASMSDSCKAEIKVEVCSEK